jgi:hypothetical protein
LNTIIVTTGLGAPAAAKQGLSFGDVARRDRQLLDVVWVCWRDPLVARLELAIEHDVVQLLTVDRQFERVPHPCILSERRLRTLAIRDVDCNSPLA